MKLETEHFVTDVPEARRCVAGNPVRRSLDIGEQQYAVGAFNIVVGAVGTKVLKPSVFRTVKVAVTHLFKQRWYCHAFSRKPLGKPARPKFVDEFKRPPLPGVAVFHGLVDRMDIVSNLGHQRRCITQCVR